MNSTPHIAVVGATGAVGVEMLRTLERRRFPVGEIRLLASARSAGRTLAFAGGDVPVRELMEESFQGIDIALFSAGSGISKRFAPVAVRAGAVAVDNSSAFRLESDVPLVIPEINGEDVRNHRGILANPNCTTAVVLMTLHPLHRAFGVVRVFASSYQAVSGSGAKAMEELRNQVRQIEREEPVAKEIYPHQIAFNVLPQVDVFLDSGYTKEEMKLEREGRRILHHNSFRASLTCVRVPVYRAHSIAVSAEFEKPVNVNEARRALEDAPGVDLVDDPETNDYHMTLDVSGKDNCAVGRLRKDCALENGLCFWVSGDQLLKGAALNAVQITEELLKL